MYSMSYISKIQYSIPNTLCKDIIDMFEDESVKLEEGIKTFDIPHSDDPLSKWFQIENFLLYEINLNLNNYINEINKPFNNSLNELLFPKNTQLQCGNFTIKKYFANTGKNVYCSDSLIDINSNRFITYRWYLNDVEDGGEIEFWNNDKIIPEKGKLILFPANWCFPYKDNIPISRNKYIITGWFYFKIK